MSIARVHDIGGSGERLRKASFKSRDGVAVDYCLIDNGSPSTLAFINGWGTTSYSEWTRQMRIKSYNLLFFNNRGNGGTGLGDGEYMRSCASDLSELCQKLGVGELNLIGHSMGGLIETLFFDEFRSLFTLRTMTFVSSPDGDPIGTFPYRFLLCGEKGIRSLIGSFEDGLLGDMAAFAEGSRLMEKAAYLVTRGGGVHMGGLSLAYTIISSPGGWRTWLPLIP